MKKIQIFKAGTHTDSSGHKYTFTEAHVAEIANGYDPALHEAPCVVGHPKHDDPAYGWVQGLEASQGALTASVGQLCPEFADMVSAGRFKKISVRLYTPDHPGNPTPGKWALRHVGFLGAQPPAVKGLRPVEFGEDGEDVVIEFGEAVDRYAPRLFQKLREWMIEQFGTEAADKALDPWDVQWLTEEAAADRAETAFAEPKPKATQEENMGANEAALKERERELEEKEAAFAETVAKAEASFAEKQARAEAATFVDGLIADGKLTKGLSDGVAAFMARLPDSKDDAVEFAEGDGAEAVTPREFFKTFLGNLGKVANFAEVSADTGEGDEGGVDSEELAARATAFMADQRAKGIEISSARAVAMVKAGKDKE